MNPGCPPKTMIKTLLEDSRLYYHPIWQFNGWKSSLGGQWRCMGRTEITNAGAAWTCGVSDIHRARLKWSTSSDRLYNKITLTFYSHSEF